MNSAAATVKTAYKPYINYRADLTNTYNKLTRDKELTVVYFGGSVTAGYGSSDGSVYSWRALSEKWLKSSFPDANIKTVNTAIGESGTYLGTYRVKKDVIDKQPDLLFIEYAINDRYKGSSKEQAALQYETIVREVRTALPECDIVTLLVTDDSASESLPELYPTAAGHEMIAKAYNIPTVNVGAALVDSLADKRAEWSKFFIDIVHPTDAGYAKYFECLEEYLYNSLVASAPAGVTSAHSMPPLQSEHLLDGARQSLMGNEMRPYVISSKGFGFSNALYYGPTDTPHYGFYYADSTASNAEITFRFQGTELGLWTNFYNQSTVEISVDSAEFVSVTCDRHAPTLLCSGLASGIHTITIRPKVYDTSTSGQMRIGALFVRDAAKQTSRIASNAGDVNSDGTTDIRDLVRMKKCMLKKQACDVNKDGSTDADDLSLLRSILLGRPYGYPETDNRDDNSTDIIW